jgi:hypothetical protein
VFVTVLACDGSRVEVVAVAAQADDPLTSASRPDGLTAPRAVRWAGWQGVIAGT